MAAQMLIPDLVSIRRACQGLRGAFHALIEKLKGGGKRKKGDMEEEKVDLQWKESVLK